MLSDGNSCLMEQYGLGLSGPSFVTNTSISRLASVTSSKRIHTIYVKGIICVIWKLYKLFPLIFCGSKVNRMTALNVMDNLNCINLIGLRNSLGISIAYFCMCLGGSLRCHLGDYVWFLTGIVASFACQHHELSICVLLPWIFCSGAANHWLNHLKPWAKLTFFPSSYGCQVLCNSVGKTDKYTALQKKSPLLLLHFYSSYSRETLLFTALVRCFKWEN